MIVALAAALAWAEPAPLHTERARLALIEGRAIDARDEAIAAITDGHDDAYVHAAYLEASDAAGLGPVALAEYEALAAADPDAALALRAREAWLGTGSPGALADTRADLAQIAAAMGGLALRDGVPEVALLMVRDVPVAEAVEIRLRAHREREAVDAALAEARAAARAFPDRPDVLAPLFVPRDAPRRLVRARDAMLDDALARLGDDALYAYRTLRLALASRDEAAITRAAAAVAAAGEPRPAVTHPPWSAAMREEMARALATHAAPRLPDGPAAERLDVAVHLARQLDAQGRRGMAIAVLADARAGADTFAAAAAHAELLLAAGRGAEARDAADSALRCAARPAEDDAARLRLDDVARELGRAHRLRAAAGDGDAALIDAAVARALGDRDGEARHTALAAAAGARSGDRVLRLAGLPLPDRAGEGAWRREVGRALHERASARQAAGDHDGALTDATAAALLAPGRDTLLRLAGLREARGWTDAAFAAAVLSGDEAALATAPWRGPGDATAAAAAVRAIAAAGGPPVAAADRGAARPGVRVGDAIPDFRLETADGPVDSRSLRGRVVIVAMWATWCSPCLRELPELSAMATRLRDEGVPVTVLAVSLDRSEADFRRFQRAHALPGLVLSWNPELGAAFRVTGIPTTWVVDENGITRFHHVGYAAGGADRLEREIRTLLRG